MANPHKGEVALGDYTLVMSINAVCELEDALGKSIDEIGAEMSGGSMRMGTLRAVVWAALQEHHPGTTMQDAGRIIGEVGMDEVGPKIGEAFQAAFPQKEGAKGKADPRKAGGRSTS